MPAPGSGIARKALLGGAFCFWALLRATAPAAEAGCAAARPDWAGAVRTVIDGDTVILSDGRAVRFIGLNTPERASEERPAEPLADAARSALQQRLAAAGRRVVLQFGAERTDRYGRLLAHPFLPDGENLTARMLRDGWGMAVAVPPNLAFQACYRAAEAEAREDAQGVWAERHFAPRDAARLDGQAAGFVRIRGRLERIGLSRDALWLQIGRVGVRIGKAHLSYFRRWNFHALQGREMVVRGWLSRRGGQARMSLKHPNDLELQGGSGETG